MTKARKSKLLNFFKKIHKWPAIIIAFFATLYAMSGIIMNHRDLISSVNISRKLLPPNYTYTNWNMGAIRGSFKLSDNEYLIYGNIGIWKCDSLQSGFTDFNNGFPKGIDNRKVVSVQKLKNKLYAGTQTGLFVREGDKWLKLKLSVKDKITDLSLKGDTLLVLTRDYLIKTTGVNDLTPVQLPAPVGYTRNTGMFELLWQLHSGELFGLIGILIVDCLGIVTIFLSVTGLLYFFFPKWIKRRKKRLMETKGIVQATRKNLHWHNVVGYIFVLFLIINTLAGMHLRPPLLIPISGMKTGIIKGTNLDTPNPWFDKLRRVQWDDDSKRYIFSTREGFYAVGESLSGEMQSFQYQPIVSLMGCNILKPVGDGNYIVGSFNGIFVWDTKRGLVTDFFTSIPWVKPDGMSIPFSDKMATGLTQIGDNVNWFDYNTGAMVLNGKILPEMTDEIREKSPMSLWNFAQEIHTSRIFEHLIGKFYFLIVPLAGICLLLVLMSGFWIWFKVYRKRK